MKKWCFTYGIKILLCALFMGAVLGVAVMLLWNWLMPDIFHLRSINFWEALGIVALAKILVGFGGWKARHCNHCHHDGHNHDGGPKGYWRKKWEEKLAKMSPEEREKVKDKYKRCWGGGLSDTSEHDQK